MCREWKLLLAIVHSAKERNFCDLDSCFMVCACVNAQSLFLLAILLYRHCSLAWTTSELRPALSAAGAEMQARLSPAVAEIIGLGFRAFRVWDAFICIPCRKVHGAEDGSCR